MFKILYAKSVAKDLNKVAPSALPRLKQAIEDLQHFPNIPQIKHLKNHPIADYRLRVGNYRILFDVDWEHMEIYILKIGHRKDVY